MPKAGITCPYAFLSFSAVSVQTVAFSLLPVVPGSQFSVQFLTAPVVISKPAAISCLYRYSVPVSSLLSVSVSGCDLPPLHQLPQLDSLPVASQFSRQKYTPHSPSTPPQT